jgi:hypothetical protein
MTIFELVRAHLLIGSLWVLGGHVFGYLTIRPADGSVSQVAAWIWAVLTWPLILIELVMREWRR